MTGNLADATRALKGDLPLLSDFGTARLVYVSGNVVYKVERPNEYGANDNEYLNYLRIKSIDMPSGWAIPEMSLYDIDGTPVLAAELIHGRPYGECFAQWSGGTCDCDTECLSAREYDLITSTTGITDLAHGNIIVNHSTYYLVDMET